MDETDENAPLRLSAEPAFVGWCRDLNPRGRWRAVCEGRDWGEALARLLDCRGAVNCEKVVLRQGDRP